MVLKGLSVSILSGGKGSRFHGQKRGILINNTPIIQHQANTLRDITDDITVITKAGKPDNTITAIEGIRVFGDMNPVFAPIIAILMAIEQSRNEYLLILACDMPFIRHDVITKLHAACENHELVVPFIDGKYQMLSSIYKRSMKPVIEEAINNKTYRLDRLVTRTKTRVIEDFSEEEKQHFVNINYRDDLGKYGLEYIQ